MDMKHHYILMNALKCMVNQSQCENKIMIHFYCKNENFK